MQQGQEFSEEPRSPSPVLFHSAHTALRFFFFFPLFFFFFAVTISPVSSHAPEKNRQVQLLNITSLIRDKWGPGRERELTLGWIISPFLIKWLKKSQNIKRKREPGSPAFSLDGREVNKTVESPQSSEPKSGAQKNRVFKDVTGLWQNRAEGKLDKARHDLNWKNYFNSKSETTSKFAW